MAEKLPDRPGPRIFFLVIALAGIVSCATAPGGNTPTPAPLSKSKNAAAPFVLLPGASSGEYFGDLTEQAARIAKENDAIFARGRMAFLFGYHNVARDLWMPLANNGYAKAQANVAWMYQTGKGLEKNLNKAFVWYMKAAKQDHSIAKNNLGVMLENGWGTQKNLSRAAYWYQEAADMGYSYGQYNYGKMLLDGAGTDKNQKEAAYWLDLAALQGVADARGLLTNKAKWDAPHSPHLAPSPRIADAAASITALPSEHTVAAPQSNISAKPKPPLKEILREAWVLNQPAKRYTLQLLSSKEEHVINAYLSKPEIPEPTAYYKANVLGENWYSVVYGVFPSFEAAQHHMGLLSPGLLRYKPWIRTYAEVHRAIKAPAE